MMSEPIDRLRQKHRRCSCLGENCAVRRVPSADWNSHCEACAVTWPCDVIAALDKLEHDATITMWHGAAVLERAGFTVTGLEAENVSLRKQARMLAEALRDACGGKWWDLIDIIGVTEEEAKALMDIVSSFLLSGDQQTRKERNDERTD